jgi:hypothetical protein
MGDGWEHRIVIESPPASTLRNPRLPVCIAGEHACPPEDVGGPHGYATFLEAVADREHEQHGDTMRWIGGGLRPKRVRSQPSEPGLEGCQPQTPRLI